MASYALNAVQVRNKLRSSLRRQGTSTAIRPLPTTSIRDSICLFCTVKFQVGVFIFSLYHLPVAAQALTLCMGYNMGLSSGWCSKHRKETNGHVQLYISKTIHNLPYVPPLSCPCRTHHIQHTGRVKPTSRTRQHLPFPDKSSSLRRNTHDFGNYKRKQYYTKKKKTYARFHLHSKKTPPTLRAMPSLTKGNAK